MFKCVQIWRVFINSSVGRMILFDEELVKIIGNQYEISLRTVSNQ